MTTWLNNLKFLMRYDIGRELRDVQNQLSRLEAGYKKTKNELLFLNVVSQAGADYEDEVAFLRQQGVLSIFPYPRLKEAPTVDCVRDRDCGMPYVLHKGRRLYFPETWSEERAAAAYADYIGTECLLGGGYMTKMPHQYQVDGYSVQAGDVVLDVGAAEGLLALDAIDVAEKVYVFEGDSVWANALRQTFRPFGNKVELVHKFVGSIDDATTVRLDSVCSQVTRNVFVKMDIEGAEPSVLQASREWLQNVSNIRLACCIYHRPHDARDVAAFFETLGFQSEFSVGYMLFLCDDLTPPYFRKGVIRAKSLR